jgi:RNA polymerase sigma-70 factor (ECF subfamily)
MSTSTHFHTLSPPHAGAAKVRAEMARDRTRERLVHTARRVLPVEDAEDAAHDAIVQALVHADSFRADAQVGTWLFRITFNAALVRQRCDHRTFQRLRRVEREADTISPLGTSATSAAHRLEEHEQLDQLRSAVARLPEAYRTVIERCVYEEQSAESVATDLGITPSALRTRITRARDRLRALLAGEGGDLRDEAAAGPRRAKPQIPTGAAKPGFRAGRPEEALTAIAADRGRHPPATLPRRSAPLDPNVLPDLQRAA